MSCLPLPGVPWGTRRWCLGRRHSRARLKLLALGGTGPLVLLVQPYQGPVRLLPHLAPASTVLSDLLHCTVTMLLSSTFQPDTQHRMPSALWYASA